MSIYKLSETVTHALFDWKDEAEAQDWVRGRLANGERVFMIAEYDGDDIMDSFCLFTGASMEAVLHATKEDGNFDDPQITKLVEVTSPSQIS